MDPTGHFFYFPPTNSFNQITKESFHPSLKMGRKPAIVVEKYLKGNKTVNKDAQT